MAKEKRGIHLIAELADVSIGTVDRALHGRGEINQSTRQRILRIARRIGYTPNLAARALSVAKTTASVGVCIPREIHFFYDQLWGGVLDEASRVEQFGIRFINRPVHALGEGDTAAFKKLVRSGVQAIILTAGNPHDLKPLKWNQFDLYIIRTGKAKYLRELEALLIRVAKPTGNRTEPKFVKHNNVTKKFEQALHKEIADLFV